MTKEDKVKGVVQISEREIMMLSFATSQPNLFVVSMENDHGLTAVVIILQVVEVK